MVLSEQVARSYCLALSKVLARSSLRVLSLTLARSVLLVRSMFPGSLALLGTIVTPWFVPSVWCALHSMTHSRGLVLLSVGGSLTLNGPLMQLDSLASFGTIRWPGSLPLSGALMQLGSLI